jgi:hypothetical protein
MIIGGDSRTCSAAIPCPDAAGRALRCAARTDPFYPATREAPVLSLALRPHDRADVEVRRRDAFERSTVGVHLVTMEEGSLPAAHQPVTPSRVFVIVERGVDPAHMRFPDRLAGEAGEVLAGASQHLNPGAYEAVLPMPPSQRQMRQPHRHGPGISDRD